MPRYRYSQLSQKRNTIRLLRLLPCKRPTEDLKCEIFEYTLQDTSTTNHPYEALSYVWGGEGKPRSIIIDAQELAVTENLYAALLRLRDFEIPRILWVDAVCINQTNNVEKEDQIQLMAIIYAKASRVLVWLGEAENDSDQALESIRAACETPATHQKTESSQQAILQLLKRPWFRRIWVLQEMAAARHVLIMCGTSEIDGYTFCFGLDSLNLPSDNPIPLVYLIRGAIFRPRYISKPQRRASLNICSLDELFDMYHAHEATKLHDKVYALLGMSSDDLSTAGLDPDYQIPWERLMSNLVKYFLGNPVSIHTWNGTEMAFIKSKGYVIGSIASIQSRTNLGGKQDVKTFVEFTSTLQKQYPGLSNSWGFRSSAKPIQEGDVICLLQGASKPAIIRLCGGHLVIIMIAVTPLEGGSGDDSEWRKIPKSLSVIREFPLIWDWQAVPENEQGLAKYDTLVQKLTETELESKMENATRIGNIALIIGESGGHRVAEAMMEKAIEMYRKILPEEHLSIQENQYGPIPLFLAAWSGYATVFRMLLTKDGVDLDLWDWEGRTLLSWAAVNGHAAVVQMLLDTGKVDVDSKDFSSRTPLSWAAENGHAAVVRMLLDTGKANADSSNYTSRTPLWLAASNGHAAVVQMLFDTGEVDADSRDSDGCTPLSRAAMNGHEAVVQLLLDTGKVEANSKDPWLKQTPLCRAAENGHKAIVQLLLNIGNANADADCSSGRTPLSWAAGNGYPEVVRALLDTGKVDAGSRDHHGQTPLFWAAAQGHAEIVQVLLDTGKVNPDPKVALRPTPLWSAAANGHAAVVRLLLDTGKVDVDSIGPTKQTPLSRAAANGHAAVVKLLLDTGKVDVNSKGPNGHTPLQRAADKGHAGVVQLLLDTSKVDSNTEESQSSRTLLLRAAKHGQKAIVQLLLNTGKVDADSRNSTGQTPLSWAAEYGQAAVVQLLLDTGRVDVNSKDSRYERTPLSWAAGNGHITVVQMLLDTGRVDTNCKDTNGDTPLSRAAEFGHEMVVKLLEKNIESVAL